jgi:hypothetical protein
MPRCCKTLPSGQACDQQEPCPIHDATQPGTSPEPPADPRQHEREHPGQRDESAGGLIENDTERAEVREILIAPGQDQEREMCDGFAQLWQETFGASTPPFDASGAWRSPKDGNLYAPAIVRQRVPDGCFAVILYPGEGIVGHYLPSECGGDDAAMSQAFAQARKIQRAFYAGMTTAGRIAREALAQEADDADDTPVAEQSPAEQQVAVLSFVVAGPLERARKCLVESAYHVGGAQAMHKAAKEDGEEINQDRFETALCKAAHDAASACVNICEAYKHNCADDADLRHILAGKIDPEEV